MLVPFAPDDIVCLVGNYRYFFKRIHENCSFIEILVCGYLQLFNVVFVSIIWQIIKDNKTNVGFVVFFLD